MPSKPTNPRAYLLHIRDNVTLARSFVGGLDYEGFRNNRLVFYGVTRALEIISEASRRLPDEIKARHPEIPGLTWPPPETSTGTIMRMCGSARFGSHCKSTLLFCWQQWSRSFDSLETSLIHSSEPRRGGELNERS